MARDLILFLRQRPSAPTAFLSFIRDHGFKGVNVGADNGPWIRRAELFHVVHLDIEVSHFTLPPDDPKTHHTIEWKQALEDQATVAKDVAAKSLMVDEEHKMFRQSVELRKEVTAFTAQLDFAGEKTFTSYPEFPLDGVLDWRNTFRRGVSQVYNRFDNKNDAKWIPAMLKKWVGFPVVEPALGQFKLVTVDGKLRAISKPIERFRGHLKAAADTGTKRAYLWTTLDFQLHFGSPEHREYWDALAEWARG